MLLSQVENYAGEYPASEAFRLLEPLHKEYAESVLQAWFAAARADGVVTAEELDLRRQECILTGPLSRLEMPASARRGIPEMLTGFFRFLSESGAYPPAMRWERDMEALAKDFAARLREDGSVKGATFKKNYTDVGRNDPCPCGSGRKFKKCCMPLISG